MSLFSEEDGSCTASLFDNAVKLNRLLTGKQLANIVKETAKVTRAIRLFRKDLLVNTYSGNTYSN